MNLRELQHNFLKSVTKNHKKHGLENIILSESIVDALQIYKNNYRYGVLGALENNFRATKNFLGEKDFSNLCLQCIDLNSSKSGNLDDYSKIFFNFIKKSNAQKQNIIKDLVHLDYFYSIIYDEKEPKIFSQSRFKEIKPDQMESVLLKLNPTTKIFYLNHSESISIWKLALKQQFRKVRINLKNQNLEAIGYKIENKIIFKILNYQESLLINAIREKKKLKEIYQLFLDKNLENNFQHILANLITEKTIVKFTIN